MTVVKKVNQGLEVEVEAKELIRKLVNESIAELPHLPVTRVHDSNIQN